MRRAAPRAALALAALALAGCLPRERVNASCAWRPDGARLGAPGSRARRAHLVADARLAQELAVRYADSAVGRPPPDMGDWVRAARGCTAAALDAAARSHAAARVTRAELGALVAERDWWFDLLAVFLPAGALAALASRAVAGRVAAGHDASSWRVPAATLAALTPVAAGLAVALAQLWAWGAETLRLRNDHISFRAGQLPVSRHPWAVAAVAAALFAAAAVGAVRRARRAAPGCARRAPLGATALGLGRSRGGVSRGRARPSSSPPARA